MSRDLCTEFFVEIFADEVLCKGLVSSIIGDKDTQKAVKCAKYPDARA